MDWSKRKQLLKQNGWEYSRESFEEGTSGAWISQDGDICFTFELKEMNDETFLSLIQKQTRDCTNIHQCRGCKGCEIII